MVTSLRCLSDMYAYIEGKLFEAGVTDVPVYKKDDKPAHYKGRYISINCLPFTYGSALNELHAMNINLHCPKLNSGGPDRKQLEPLLEFICSIIPQEEAYEDAETLYLNGVHYAIHTQSDPIEDKDDTYFINLRLSLTF